MENTHSTSSPRTIKPHQLYDAYEKGQPIELIDVRMPAEYREVHATMARLVPLDRLNPAEVFANRTLKDEPLYVICHSGSRARKACEAFAAAGFGDRVVNVEGGTLAWELAGLPVERGKKTISLERQMRIVAGSLILLGAALGAFVHPGFYALSAFVGGGLIFAGVTDICPMAMGLARLPWNQAGASPTCPR